MELNAVLCDIANIYIYKYSLFPERTSFDTIFPALLVGMMVQSKTHTSSILAEVSLTCIVSLTITLIGYCYKEVIFTSDDGLLARSQYPEGPATGHLDTSFSCFPCVYKQMLRRFPTFPVATTCFSCSPPDLNLLVKNFTFCIHVK